MDSNPYGRVLYAEKKLEGGEVISPFYFDPSIYIYIYPLKLPHLLSYHLHQSSFSSPFPSYLHHSPRLHHTHFVVFFSFKLFLLFIIHLCLHHSAASLPHLPHLSRCPQSFSIVSPLFVSFLFSLFSFPCPSLPCHHLLAFSFSFHLFPSWQSTVQEAGTSTCTSRLSGDCHRVFLCYLNPIRVKLNEAYRHIVMGGDIYV